MITEFSETGGYFRSDNFVSNETSFQYVIPELQRSTRQGGVYLGVAPDQNFTYLVALKPRIAFIVDIRRQNMIQHLMYKALIEMAKDRADFMAGLFARRRPPGLDSASTVEALFAGYSAVPPDSAMFTKTLAAMTDWLTKKTASHYPPTISRRSTTSTGRSRPRARTSPMRSRTAAAVALAAGHRTRS
jgi:hypothetical protein